MTTAHASEETTMSNAETITYAGLVAGDRAALNPFTPGVHYLVTEVTENAAGTLRIRYNGGPNGDRPEVRSGVRPTATVSVIFAD